MFIIDQWRTEAVNTDYTQNTYQSDRCVFAVMKDGSTRLLGNYKSKGRALEVFTDLLKNVFPEPLKMDPKEAELDPDELIEKLSNETVMMDAVYTTPTEEYICAEFTYYMPEE